MNRLRELDFLRGIAILLVLFRHQFLFAFTKNMGWIGVDLFFVLSGFLVSGLLFKEYLRFGNIQPKRFLIRRGFKIYPIYYLFYIPYLIQILFDGNFKALSFLSDLTFLQNYINGWGFAFAASWSLAIEEHFYFGFAILLWLGIKYGKVSLIKKVNDSKSICSFEIAILSIMVCCLVARLLTNIFYPSIYPRNFTMTHLRIDSLLAGVLVSYMYYFRIDSLKTNFHKYKRLLLLIAFLGLSWTPFISPFPSFFVKTIGFSLLYFSFAILLLYFLLETEINKNLNRLFTAPVVTGVSKIGFCSYSIYIIHTFVNHSSERIISNFHLYNNYYLNFLITSIASLSIGMLMTYKIEKYFLKLRDRHFPSRV